MSRTNIFLGIALLIAVVTLGSSHRVLSDAVSRYLPPQAFSDLPPPVQTALEGRRCSVPQPSAQGLRRSIARGRFTTSTETDLAVLCANEGSSTILIFRGGRASDVVALAPRPDDQYMQLADDANVGYGRAVAVARPAEIRTHHRYYGGREPPPLDHDGVDDAFVEKASVVWYWYEGEWLQLQGVD
jgi:hypothetical protein